MRVSTPLAFVALACVLALTGALPTSLRGRAYTQRAQGDLDARTPVSGFVGGRRGRAARFQARALRGVEVARSAEADEGSGSGIHAESGLEARMDTNLLSHAYEPLAPAAPSSTTSSSPSPPTPDPTPLTPTPHAAAEQTPHKKTKTKQGSSGHKKAGHHTLASVE